MPTAKDCKSALSLTERQLIAHMRKKTHYTGRKTESYTGRLGVEFGSAQHKKIIEHNKKPLRVKHRNVEPTYEHTLMSAL